MSETPPIEINDRFARALRLMEETDKILFVTGKAGTGKSTLLEHFCKAAKTRPAVLAPTGVAALNVKGQTIHSFFNFYADVTPQKIRERKIRPRDPTVYKKLETIVIDEASMVRADLLDSVDAFLRMYGPRPGTPFGGVRMALVGDLCQLPPVVTGPEREIFSGHYKTPYFFSAHAFADAEIEVVELEKVYRQKDQAFVDLLNRVRSGSVDDADIARLNGRVSAAPRAEGEFYVSLTATNKKADEINDMRLHALPGKIFRSRAETTGEFGREYFPTATELQFKTGAQIMLLNNDRKGRWVNGSIGVIEDVGQDEEDERYLEVRLQDGEETVRVYPFTWEVYRLSVDGGALVSEPAGTFTQYPFRLAWAITIHKSQGKTFDRVEIDVGGGTFVPGQMYVALSRCTSFEGVVLRTPIRKQHIRTDYRIYEFLTAGRRRKAEQECPLEERIALIAAAVREKAELDVVYLKADDTETRRRVVPLSVGRASYQGKPYQGMKAYCALRQEERMFRVDRILEVKRADG